MGNEDSADVLSEADTCRKFVVPKLVAAGWDNDPHSIAEHRTITDGRIVPVGKGFVRKPPKRVDYLLRYTRDFPLGVVEAKAAYKTASSCADHEGRGTPCEGKATSSSAARQAILPGASVMGDACCAGGPKA